MVRKMPTLPLPAPCSALTINAIGKEVEKPHNKLVSMVLNKPSRMMVLRPYLSEARPQAILVAHWPRLKMAEAIPAHFAILFFGTLKLSTISGR